MGEMIKKTFKDNCVLSIVESIIVIILGVILICKPTLTIKIVISILGIIFLAGGVFKIMNYLLTKKKYDFYNYDAVFGIMACILGIITLIYNSEVLRALQMIIGIWIIYTAVVRMSVSIKLKRLELNVWTYSLILSIIMFGCGLFVILKPEMVVITLGVIMIIYSVIDIIEDIILVKNVKEIL